MSNQSGEDDRAMNNRYCAIPHGGIKANVFRGAVFSCYNGRMNKVEKIAKHLHSVSEAHHAAFERSDGEDKDWPLWYAKWLLKNTSIADALSRGISESELAGALSSLDAAYTSHKSELDWTEYYALNIGKFLA